ncbi:MAG: DUF1636 domain-containing protein [Pseudomonadota bacterium]
MASDTTILICTKCRGSNSAAAMRQTLTETVASGVIFRAVDCMAGCDHPVAVGVQAEGKASYLFGGIETEAEIAAIARFVRDYAASEKGWTNSGERPAALTGKTLARLPGLLP